MKNKKIASEWIEQINPYVDTPIDSEMFGADIRIKIFKIYEDNKIKVTRIEDPTYANEYNNYVQLFIKKGSMIIDFPIGGYITRDCAISNAKIVASIMLKHW